MVERKHITLIYQYNDNWIGGTYYILNIIKALCFLDDRLKPKLSIVIDKGSNYEVIQNLNYPFIEFIPVRLTFNIAEKIINRISRILLKRPTIKLKIPGEIEFLYPVSDFICTKNVKKFYYWIPDFQEHYLPNFFSAGEINDRVNTQLIIQKTNVPVVFSSYSAQNDYNKFYHPNNNKKAVLNFVSILDDKYLQVPKLPLFNKYSITRPYFIIPNQFWKHKNQEVVLKAAKLLANQNSEFQLIFTGKEFDHRHPNHVSELREYIKDNGLDERIQFLGFIDRDEQLQLMKNSVAIIQPSLFEGWSTVVEDTKAINHFIILSNIDLHKEQINENCLFFDPYSPEDLALSMSKVLKGVEITNIDYPATILEFSNKFISIF